MPQGTVRNTDTRKCILCEGLRCMGSQFCVAHKCRRRCICKRMGSSEYCVEHKCKSCDGVAVDGGEYCLAHKCKEECLKPRAGLSEYCTGHKCCVCSAQRQPKSNFCTAHKCIKIDCNSERFELSQYCKAHRVPPKPDTTSQVTITLGEYETRKILGSGSFSQVRMASIPGKTTCYAIKIVSNDAVQEMQCEDLLCTEISILQHLHHKNIVVLYDAFRTQRSVCLTMEYLTGGELFDLISTHHRLPEETTFGYYRQLLEGVCYLHSMSVAHRDIKPENLLLENGVLKIADLGFAAYQREGEMLQEALGTPEYQAPEVLPGRPYCGFAADMWSCGVVLYTMLVGALPFDGQGDDAALHQAIVQGMYIPEYISSGTVDVLNLLVNMRPAERPTAYDLLTNRNLATYTDTPVAPLQRRHEANNEYAILRGLSSLPLYPAENESLLYSEMKSWSITGLLEEAAGFIGNLGMSNPTAPSKVIPQRALVRPQNRWRRGR